MENFKICTYSRKSTDDAKKQISSISDQDQQNLLLATRNGLIIEKTFSESKTAKKPGRIEFNKMLDEIEKGKYNVIICWLLDRISRNGVDGGKIIWMLQTGKIKKIITSSREYAVDDIAFMYMELGMANDYILKLSKNVKRGMSSKVMNGGFASPAPTGYINKDKRILANELYFAFIQTAFRMLIYEKAPIYVILKYLNSNKILTGRGNAISKSTLSNMLHNPFYAGFVRCGDINMIRGNHIPMISAEEFETAKAILKRNSDKYIKNARSQFNLNFILNKVIKCENCGANMSGSISKKIFGYYRCYNRLCNSHQSINSKAAEIIFIKNFITRFSLTESEIMKVKIMIENKLKKEYGEIDSQIDSKVHQLLILENKMKRLELLIIEGTIEYSTFYKYKEDFILEKDLLNKELNYLYNLKENVHTVFNNSLKFLINFKVKYRSLPIEDKFKVNSSFVPNGFFCQGVASQ